MNNIIVRNSNRFKSIFVSVNLILPLEAKLNSRNALLAEILEKGNALYKTKKELETELASLYNTNLETNVEKIDNWYNIRFGMELLNVNFMDKTSVEKAKDILLGVILNPNISNGIFDEETFNREKQALIQKIMEERDDKKVYALKELEQDMFKNIDYGKSVYGDISDIQTITNEMLVKHYYYVLENAHVIVACSRKFG